MSPELDEYLCKKYPKIFIERHLSIQESAMPWGFQHGDGWKDLIDNLCGFIQSRIDNNPHLNIPQVVFETVKEKFSTLRIYYSGGDETISGAVQFAEYLSGSICEECGTQENVGMTTGGWHKTICKDCLDKSNLNKELWRQNE